MKTRSGTEKRSRSRSEIWRLRRARRIRNKTRVRGAGPSRRKNGELDSSGSGSGRIEDGQGGKEMGSGVRATLRRIRNKSRGLGPGARRPLRTPKERLDCNGICLVGVDEISCGTKMVIELENGRVVRKTVVKLRNKIRSRRGRRPVATRQPLPTSTEGLDSNRRIEETLTGTERRNALEIGSGVQTTIRRIRNKSRGRGPGRPPKKRLDSNEREETSTGTGTEYRMELKMGSGLKATLRRIRNKSRGRGPGARQPLPKEGLDSNGPVILHSKNQGTMANQKDRLQSSSGSGGAGSTSTSTSTSTGGGGGGGTASGSGGRKPQFKVNEKVLCYEPDIKKAQVLYDSKVLEVVRKQDSSNGVYYEYKIHFQGWKCTWDRYVREDNVLKTSPENRELQRQLRERVDEDKATQKKKKKKITIKEKLQAVQEAAVSSNAKESPAKVQPQGITRRSPPPRTKQVVLVVGNYTSTPEGGLDPYSEPERLVIPDDLRTVLDFDSNKIRIKKWLIKLPCEITIIDLLEEYIHHIGRLELRSYIQKVQNLVSSQTGRTGNGRGAKLGKSKSRYVAPAISIQNIVNEELIKTMERIEFSKKVVESVRMMFETLLPQILLFKNELDQYNEFLKGDFSPQKKQKKPVPPKPPVQKPKPVEDDSDDLIVQNVIKKNMPPPPVPPLKRRTRSADNLSNLSLDVEIIAIKAKKGRKSTSALPSLSSMSGSSPSTTGAVVEMELDPTIPLEMMPLSEIKTEPLDEVEVVEPPIKRKKLVTSGAINSPNLPGTSSSALKHQTAAKKSTPIPAFSMDNIIGLSPSALLDGSDKMKCELEDKCEFPWACQHLNKFMDEMNIYQLPPLSEVNGEYPAPHPSECYGMQHLLRLFVKLPMVLNEAEISGRIMSSIVSEMNSILLYFVSIKGVVTKDDWHHPGITLYEEDYINENNCHLFAKGTPSRKLLKKSKRAFKNSKEKRGDKSKKRCLVTGTKNKNGKKEKRGRKKSKEIEIIHLSPIKTLSGQKVAVQLHGSPRNSRRLSGKMDPTTLMSPGTGGAIAMGVRKSLTQEELSRETLVAATANITATATTSSTPAAATSPIAHTSIKSSKESKSTTSYSLRHHSRTSYK